MKRSTGASNKTQYTNAAAEHTAYTLDSSTPGEIYWETFSGDAAKVITDGVTTHHGDEARGMVNAAVSGKLLAAIPPRNVSRPRTRPKEEEGFIHPILCRRPDPAGRRGNPSCADSSSTGWRPQQRGLKRLLQGTGGRATAAGVRLHRGGNGAPRHGLLAAQGACASLSWPARAFAAAAQAL